MTSAISPVDPAGGHRTSARGGSQGYSLARRTTTPAPASPRRQDATATEPPARCTRAARPRRATGYADVPCRRRQQDGRTHGGGRNGTGTRKRPAAVLNPPSSPASAAARNATSKRPARVSVGAGPFAWAASVRPAAPGVETRRHRARPAGGPAGTARTGRADWRLSPCAGEPARSPWWPARDLPASAKAHTRRACRKVRPGSTERRSRPRRASPWRWRRHSRPSHAGRWSPSRCNAHRRPSRSPPRRPARAGGRSGKWC